MTRRWGGGPCSLFAVLKVELEIDKFLKAAPEQLRFTMQLTSYQRAAIHRVAYFYQMQSDKIVLDEDPLGPGHILIRKTPRTKAPAVRCATHPCAVSRSRLLHARPHTHPRARFATNALEWDPCNVTPARLVHGTPSPPSALSELQPSDA